MLSMIRYNCAVATVCVAAAFLLSAICLGGCAKEERFLIEMEDTSEILQSPNEMCRDENEKSYTQAVSDKGDYGDATPKQEKADGTQTQKGALPETVYVHVCGTVASPGVYALKAGSRTVEAITAAGGYLPGAATDYLNLASVITDGQKIYVPSLDEIADMKTESGKETLSQSGYEAGDSTNGVISAIQESDAWNNNGLININQAEKSQLMTLEGIGDKKSEAIIEYRNENGSFNSVEELLKVPGIKKGTYDKIKDMITV